MPYPTIKAAQDAGFPTKAEEIDLTLAQVNHLARIYDAIKEGGKAKNPMAVAWEQWKKLYVKKGDKWERRKTNFLSGPLVNIKRMEIFRTGTWNDQKFGESDIQIMADNFHVLKGVLTPKLKITHRDNQKSIAGLASYGDVTNIYVGGKKLYADLTAVPLQVAEWIRDKRFSERSIELHHRYMIDRKEYQKVISAIALLGHEIPAVSGMEPVKLNKEDNILNKEETTSVAFVLDSDSIQFEIENPKKKEVTQMELKEVMAKIAEMEKTIANFMKLQEDAKSKLAKEKQEAEVTALKIKIAEYAKNIEQFETMKTDYEKMKVALKKAEEEKLDYAKKTKASEVDVFISAQKIAGKILPVFEEEVKAILVGADTEKKIGKFAKMGEDGKSSDTELSQFEAITNLISKLPKLVDFKENSNNHKGNDMDEKTRKVNGDAFELDSVELNKEAEKYMKENECSFEDALAKVSSKFKAEGKAQGISTEE